LIRKAYHALERNQEYLDAELVDFEDLEYLDANDVEEEGCIEDEVIESKLVGRPLFQVNLIPEYNQQEVVCLAEKTVRLCCELHPIVIKFLCQQWEEDDEDYPFQGVTTLDIFTEYKRNGTIYRAHPNYNSFGEWYDWAMIKFESEGDRNFPVNQNKGYYDNKLYPSKILCFLQAEDMSIYAVAHCCCACDHEGDSILMERWTKEYAVDENMLVPVLRCVSVDSIECPCFVVEDKTGVFEEMGRNVRKMNNGVTLVKPREEGWATQFH